MIYILKAWWWDGVESWFKTLYISTNLEKVESVKKELELKYSPLLEKRKELEKYFDKLSFEEYTDEKCDELWLLKDFEYYQELKIETFELEVLKDFTVK